MHHGPDPYARALADLDRRLDLLDRGIERWAIEAAREVDRNRAYCRSLRAAIRASLATDLEQSIRRRFMAVIEQTDEVDK